MDNFDLKKYLAEGKLHKSVKIEENAGGIMLDGNTMMGGDWDAGLSAEERAFAEKNLIGKRPAQEWLSNHGKFWEMIGEFGGDSDVIEDGLLDHVSDGLLNINEATSVWEMYWDGGQDSEAKERFQDSCVIALVKGKFGNHPEYSGWEQDYRSIGAADFADDFDDNNKILQGAEAYLKGGDVNEGAKKKKIVKGNWN
jgi:hypothetical protein